VFQGEGISVTVRTGERHEVSEKVCMRMADMPNPESSDGILWLREGRLEEDQGRGESLIWARMLEFCLLQRSNQERRMNLLMKRKRSELEGWSEDRMDGRSSACLAAESTFSLPGISLWPGAQMKVTEIEIAMKVVRREWIRVTSGWEEDG